MDILTWIYLFNATLIIVHEIESAYWEEWKLFRLPSGLEGFLLVPIPLVAVILYGLVEVNNQSPLGKTLSVILSLRIVCLLHSYLFQEKRG